MKSSQHVSGATVFLSLLIGMLTFALASLAYAQTTTITTTLEPGMTGSEVSALQTFLAADPAVYPEGLITGYYGSLTTSAVQRYQCKNGIVCSGSVESTGYGRVGPLTLAKINGQGGTPSGGGDQSAPILGAPIVSTTSTSAAITWSTSELARSRVLYSTTLPMLSAAAFAAMPSVADPSFDASSNVFVGGLVPNTTYYYILESTDASGNVQYGIDHSFRTNP